MDNVSVLEIQHASLSHVGLTFTKFGSHWDAPYSLDVALLLNSPSPPVEKPQGSARPTVNALKAGLAVPKREGVDRGRDMNPTKSFAAIGVTTSA